ncbi:unnamed protein product [Cylicocyclus nassatus]|uniref:Potassium channel domain-containing protein n=1 Tax=Cylicocyclus nassatus TaxID=53992 RepID=A0AA36H5L7_CYLNA|nr:unnamed protein product [Cylicocyclus nassatus]
MPEEDDVKLDHKKTSLKHPSLIRPSSAIVVDKFEDAEPYNNGLDSVYHTFTNPNRRVGRIINKTPETGRKFLKFRSHSFSEGRPRKSSSFVGTAKDRAYERRSPMKGKARDNVSSPTIVKSDKEKAVNDYYERHQLSTTSEKSFESLNDGSNELSEPARKNGDVGSIHKKETIIAPADVVPTSRKFHNSIYWMLHNRSRFGFRHICMLLLVLSYTLLGALIFFELESKYEQQTIVRRQVALDAQVEIIAEELLRFSNESGNLELHKVHDFVRAAYITLLKEEDLYAGSTYHKKNDSANYKWTFASAIFFSMNLYTTTGYGSIAPDSNMGRLCVIIYSLIAIPVTLVVLRDLGQWTLVILTKFYAHVLVLYRRSMGYDEPHDDSMISLPIKFCLSLLAGYLLFSAIFVYKFDDWYGDVPNTGLSFFISFYFSFISISTIGLGDIMPNNAPFHPLISALFFFGMPIMKVVNRATYVCIENGIFGAFTLLETTIDNVSTKIQPKESFAQRPRVRTISRCSYCSHINMEDDLEQDKTTALLNNLTIRSLGQFARANADVYGGGFGRVNLRKGDLVQSKTSINQGPA